MKLAIIDFNRTLYDPDTDNLMPGALELLMALAKRGVRMALLSRDVASRADLLERLGILDFFSETAFVPDKTGAVVRGIMERQEATPEETYVIGDYIYQDIRAGNEAGAYTIQFKQGMLSDREPQTQYDVPRAVIHSLEDAVEIVSPSKSIES